jgi:hypothetical protein
VSIRRGSAAALTWNSSKPLSWFYESDWSTYINVFCLGDGVPYLSIYAHHHPPTLAALLQHKMWNSNRCRTATTVIIALSFLLAPIGATLVHGSSSQEYTPLSCTLTTSRCAGDTEHSFSGFSNCCNSKMECLPVLSRGWGSFCVRPRCITDSCSDHVGSWSVHSTDATPSCGPLVNGGEDGCASK